MGFLPGFEDDVFISYAHNDNELFGPEKLGWVEQLHVELAKRIKTYLNYPPQLWRDSDITPNDLFDEKIANRLSHSATMLTVLSDNFLERPYCQLEVKVFCEKAGTGLRVGEKCRIFKVELRPLTRTKLPSEFDGTGRYPFYDPGTASELRPSVRQEDIPRYWAQLDSLARDIADTLRRMQRGVQCGGAPETEAGTVYLAQTTGDQEEVREKIRRDLQDRSITVLPAGDLSVRGAKFEEEVRAGLAKADLSIHIFGNDTGFVPEGRQRASTWLQHDLAMERAKDTDFRRILWLPAEMATVSAGQRQYLESLQADAGAQHGAEILWGKLEDLKTEVNRALEEIHRQREERKQQEAAAAAKMAEATAKTTVGVAKPAGTAVSDEPLTVYLICDERDLQSPRYRELEDFLFANRCETLKSLPAESPEEARRLHEEYLQDCDACLIYYGAASEGWVTTKLCDCKKYGGKREAPFRAKGVYVAPPLNDAKRTFRTLLAPVIPGGEQFSGGPLAAFLAALQKA